MAQHPTMRTRDGRWQVEVITTRGTLVSSIAEVRSLLGNAFTELVEVRDRGGSTAAGSSATI